MDDEFGTIFIGMLRLRNTSIKALEGLEGPVATAQAVDFNNLARVLIDQLLTLQQPGDRLRGQPPG